MPWSGDEAQPDLGETRAGKIRTSPRLDSGTRVRFCFRRIIARGAMSIALEAQVTSNVVVVCTRVCSPSYGARVRREAVVGCSYHLGIVIMMSFPYPWIGMRGAHADARECREVLTGGCEECEVSSFPMRDEGLGTCRDSDDTFLDA